jgi:hypothetical protein
MKKPPYMTPKSDFLTKNGDYGSGCLGYCSKFPSSNIPGMANLTWYNIASIAVVCLGGFTYGFGFAVFASSIGQPGFYAYFNLDRESCYPTRAYLSLTKPEQQAATRRSSRPFL